ncbi:MAG: hypothetical protein ACK5AM_06920, partial [Pirellulaceae bacterium]
RWGASLWRKVVLPPFLVLLFYLQSTYFLVHSTILSAPRRKSRLSLKTGAMLELRRSACGRTRTIRCVCAIGSPAGTAAFRYDLASPDNTASIIR